MAAWFRADPLPAHLGRTALSENIVGRYVHLFLSRPETPDAAHGVAETVRPILDAALDQPACASALRRIASEEHEPAAAARREWLDVEEADIFLESGGDPNALSHAGAAGVAQWMNGTAQRAGLRVDTAASGRLTAQIAAATTELRLASTPGSGAEAAARASGLRRSIADAQARRAAVDERYDPRKALFAQARYLLGLWPRFPARDWLYAAYHGGVGGAQRMMRAFLGPQFRSTAEAVRHGLGGRPLHFDDVYFLSGPRSHEAAFAYLYSRSDDHRHYVWKIRAAMRVLALYRRSPAEFRAACATALPGRAPEAAWYPDAEGAALDTASDCAAAAARGLLVPVAPGHGLALAAPGAPWSGRPLLLPAALGAARLVADRWRQAGGRGALTLAAMTRATDQGSPPPGPGAPAAAAAAFDFHTTGIAFDIAVPPRPLDAERLAWVLDRLMDEDVVTVAHIRRPGAEAEHVVPNPRFGLALAALVGARVTMH